MTYISHLNTFLSIARRDKRLSCAHFSMYIALFYVWNGHRFINPFYIVREDLMGISHIGSKTTYSKVLADLHEFGYIRLEKPKNKYWKSRITMAKFSEQENDLQLKLFENPGMQGKQNIPLKTLNGVPLLGHLNSPKSGHLPAQNRDTNLPNNGTLTVPLLGHSINKDIKEVIKRESDSPHPHINPIKNVAPENSHESIAGRQKCAQAQHTLLMPVKCILPASQKDISISRAPNFPCHPVTTIFRSITASGEQVAPVIPTSEQVVQFFMSLNSEHSLPLAAGHDGAKFFNHYAAIGWKLGGTNPIVDWQAAARKWILNSWHHPPPAAEIKSQGAPPANIAIPPKPDYSAPL